MFSKFFNNIKQKSSDVEKPKEVNKKQEIELTQEEIDFFIEKKIKMRLSSMDDQGIQISQGLDKLIDEAAKIVVQYQQGSTSLIQRRMNLGYNRAGRIMEQLELLGIVGPALGSKARAVLVTSVSDLDAVMNGTFYKEEFFEKNILPYKLDYIESRVNGMIENRKREQTEALKEELRKELIAEEDARLEKLRIKNLRDEIRREMIEQGIISDEDIRCREAIPQELQDRVWNRDEGKCIKCGSREKLEFDHIIPFSKGGSNSYRNLQILCEKCNREKNNKIGG